MWPFYFLRNMAKNDVPVTQNNFSLFYQFWDQQKQKCILCMDLSTNFWYMFHILGLSNNKWDQHKLITFFMLAKKRYTFK